jgi:F0F1-type ATP synthase membrane subunit b/b'
MRGLWLKLFLSFALLCGVSMCRPQQPSEDASKQETSEPQGLMTWKIINTAIFAILLGWGISKTAPKFFNARSADIQKAIKDATGLKIEADFRYSAMDRKMATLGEEVKRIKAEWEAAMEREHQRLNHETQEERERIQHHVAAEIEGFQGESLFRLRQHTAQAAFALAERRLRDQAPVQQDDLVHEFVHLVEGSAK